MDKFGLSEYGYRKAQEAFNGLGTIGLIGLEARQFVEDLPLEVERKVFVLKHARPWIPCRDL
jgi:hypothetical protein